MKFGIGQPVRRFEDLRLITGGGRYTDDIVLPQMAHAFVLRSPVAHAQDQAHRYAGGPRHAGRAAGATGEDVEADGLGDVPCVVPLTNRDGTPRHDTPRPVLAVGKVRHVGQPVALVVAETLRQARDAAEAIDDRIRDAAGRRRSARRASSPARRSCSTHIPGNLVFDWDNDMCDFARRPMRRSPRPRTSSRSRLVNNRVVVNSMEPRNAIGDYDPASGRSTLYTGDAGPAFRARSARRDRAQDAEGQAARDHARMSAAASA